MIDRTEVPIVEADVDRNTVYVLLHQAFEHDGASRDRYLTNALCAIAVVCGVDAFTRAMRGAADKLLS